jgi:uncharacterized protein YndB with AHSA1/START domain
MADVRATVRQIVLASPERTFRAFVDVDDLDDWMFGPNIRAERIVSLKADVRVGGQFSFVVERRGEMLDHRGLYRIIEPPRRLAFTWIVNAPPAHGDLISVEFAPLMLGTEVTLAHHLASDWVSEKPKIEAAWAKMLGALALHLAAPMAGSSTP